MIFETIFVIGVLGGMSIPIIGWLHNGYKYRNYDQGYPPKLKVKQT